MVKENDRLWQDNTKKTGWKNCGKVWQSWQGHGENIISIEEVITCLSRKLYLTSVSWEFNAILDGLHDEEQIAAARIIRLSLANTLAVCGESRTHGSWREKTGKCFLLFDFDYTPIDC